MTLTNEEKRTVLAVFDELCKQTDRQLNTFLGSVTIREMRSLYGKLYYNDYCESHGIKYEDMTVDDFVDAYEEGF